MCVLLNRFLLLVILELLVQSDLRVLREDFRPHVEIWRHHETGLLLGDSVDRLGDILLFHPAFPLRFEFLAVRLDNPRSLLGLGASLR